MAYELNQEECLELQAELDELEKLTRPDANQGNNKTNS